MKHTLPVFTVLILLGAAPLLSQTYVSSSPDSVCAGTTNVVYRIPPASANPTSTYNWSITGGGTVVSQADDDSIYVNWSATPGTNSVNVTETVSGGCTSLPASIEVIRYRPSATLSGPAVTACAGIASVAQYTVNFTGRAPFSITYSFSDGVNTIGPFTENNILVTSHTINANISAAAAEGSYTLTITAASDKGGCAATGISGTGLLTVGRPTVPIASVTTQPSCSTPAGIITVTAPTGAGITYSIGGAYQAGTTFSGLVPGPYTLTAKDSNGCISQASAVVTVNDVPSAPPAPVIQHID